MKPVSDDAMEQFESVALEGLKKLREYFKYEGSTPGVYQKAKVAATAIAAYTRLRASESNRMAVELMTEKFEQEQTVLPPAASGPKRLK